MATIGSLQRKPSERSLGTMGSGFRRRNSYWRRESRKFKEPVEKALRAENVQMKQSNAGEVKTNEAIKVLGEALQECGIENEIATYMKKKFDEKFGPSWQCIVGRNFGSHLDTIEFIHLAVSKIAVLLFRCR